MSVDGGSGVGGGGCFTDDVGFLVVGHDSENDQRKKDLCEMSLSLPICLFVRPSLTFDLGVSTGVHCDANSIF